MSARGTGVEKIRERAAAVREREQARKAGMRTQATNERLANVHADYVQSMRRAGDFQCTHPALTRENGKLVMVFCEHCDPQRG